VISASDSAVESNGDFFLAIPAWWTTTVVHFFAARK
jgi:hypothetical protein